eukprot:4621879-Pleurochrysis_carterae.AAC.1
MKTQYYPKIRSGLSVLFARGGKGDRVEVDRAVGLVAVAVALRRQCRGVDGGEEGRKEEGDGGGGGGGDMDRGGGGGGGGYSCCARRGRGRGSGDSDDGGGAGDGAGDGSCGFNDSCDFGFDCDCLRIEQTFI